MVTTRKITSIMELAIVFLTSYYYRLLNQVLVDRHYFASKLYPSIDFGVTPSRMEIAGFL